MTDPKGRGKTCEPDVKAIVERLPIAAKLIKIADASRREDGTDIPLGEQCREAAALISQLTAERDASAREWREAFDGMHKRAMDAEQRVKELEEGRDLDKVVLDEGIEIINELESSNKLLSGRVAVLEKERDALASVITPGHPDPALMSRIIMKSIENECLAEVAETALENGQAFANQVSHITYLLNGQAYSSTVSALNDFNAHLRRARTGLEGK